MPDEVDKKLDEQGSSDDEFDSAFVEATEQQDDGAGGNADDGQGQNEQREDGSEGSTEGTTDQPGEGEKASTEDDKLAALKGMFESKTKELEEKIEASKPDGKKEEDKEGNKADDGLDFSDDPELKEFFDEYDYLAAPIKRMIERAVSVKSIASRAAPTNEEIAATIANAIHFDKIVTAHPDFEEIRDSGKLKTFVDTYAGPDKEKVQKAFTNGTAADVIDLVNRFKGNNGAPAGEKKEKLRNLQVVRTKQSGVNVASTGVAEDYDSAFEEAANRK